MKKLMSCLLFLTLIMNKAIAQQPQSKFICGTTDSMMLNFRPDTSSLLARDSRNGLVFTAKDTLRALIIYCGFTNDNTPDHALYDSLSVWPWDSIAPHGAKKLFYKNFSQFDTAAQDLSISNFYYQMSRHAVKPFKLIADVFPQRIDVTADSVINSKGTAAFVLYNEMVLDTIQKYYPNFNWGKYDNRMNWPWWNYDYSSYLPDNAIDYVIAVWRYSNGTFNMNAINTAGGFNGIAAYNVVAA